MKELLTELAEKAKDYPVYPDKRFPPSMYYRFLRLLAAELKPKISVELGVCGGGGSLHLAAGYPKGKVYGVDIKRDHPENTDYIEKNYPNFEFYLSDSSEAAGTINKKVDILFIDTDHTQGRTESECNAWFPYLSKNAVVCFDDLFRHHPDDKRGMGDVWNDLKCDKLRLDFLHNGTYPHGGGFGIAWNIR